MSFLGICPEDRVIFIGTTKSPWDAEQKLLFQCYQKFIQVPRADYGSISMLWRTKLHRAGALNPRLEVSCLARVSDSYTIGTSCCLMLRKQDLFRSYIVLFSFVYTIFLKEENGIIIFYTILNRNICLQFMNILFNI